MQDFEYTFVVVVGIANPLNFETVFVHFYPVTNNCPLVVAAAFFTTPTRLEVVKILFNVSPFFVVFL